MGTLCSPALISRSIFCGLSCTLLSSESGSSSIISSFVGGSVMVPLQVFLNLSKLEDCLLMQWDKVPPVSTFTKVIFCQIKSHSSVIDALWNGA